MITALAIIIGSLFLWELVGGILLAGWGLLDLLRQVLLGDR